MEREISVVQILSGRSANSTIVHVGDGFYYNLREVRRRRIRLQCRHRKQGCKGNASLSLDHRNCLVLKSLQVHSCSPDPLLPEDMAAFSTVVQEARQCVSGASVRKILRDFRLRLDPELARRFTVKRMHSTLYVSRSANYPKIPKTLIYLGVLLGLPGMRGVCKTRDGMDFIFQGLVGNQASKTVAVVFASGRMLQFLQTRPNLHMDGTFKKRPRKPKCRQIFNIVTNYGDCITALLRVLMMSRSEIAYVALFNFIKQLAPNLHPNRIHCDFERATINALRLTFPTSTIVGCIWHFGVCVGRNAVKKDLAPLAAENDLVHSYIRCLCGAPLLPAGLISAGVEEIWAEIKTSSWAAALEPLFNYFRREWIPRIYELSVFGQPERTNNCSESDNRSIANFVPQNHPNIWTLIGGFVQLEHISYSDKLAADRGDAAQFGRRWKTIANDKRIMRLSRLLNQDEISPGRFLQAASWVNQGALNQGMKLDPESSDSESD